MHRKIRVLNPHYRAVPINWSIQLSKPVGMNNGIREGELELAFHSRDENRRTSFRFPCFVSGTCCAVKKIGTMKKYDLDDRCTEEAFSVVGKMKKEPENGFLRVFNTIIETVARNCGEMISSTSGATSLTGTSLISPKVMRIPKMITIQEISYEELLENGQL